MGRLLVSMASVLLLVACKSESPSADTSTLATTSLAEDGTDANDLESHASALTASSTLAMSSFDTPARAILAAVSTTKNFFLPAGCVTSALDANDHATVIHTFDACTGPWGLTRFSGTLTVHHEATTQDGVAALKLDVTGSQITFRKGTADFHATAIVSADGASRHMVYDAQLSGTTSRGRALSRTVTWDETWQLGEQCITLNGETDGSVNSRDIKTTVTNYQRCRGECPAAGGTIELTSTKPPETVKIETTGGSTVTVTNNGQAPVDVTLACGL